MCYYHSYYYYSYCYYHSYCVSFVRQQTRASSFWFCNVSHLLWWMSKTECRYLRLSRSSDLAARTLSPGGCHSLPIDPFEHERFIKTFLRSGSLMHLRVFSHEKSLSFATLLVCLPTNRIEWNRFCSYISILTFN